MCKHKKRKETHYIEINENIFTSEEFECIRCCSLLCSMNAKYVPRSTTIGLNMSLLHVQYWIKTYEDNFQILHPKFQQQAKSNEGRRRRMVFVCFWRRKRKEFVCVVTWVRERERERERETEEKEGVVICFRGLVKFLLWKISLLLITYIGKCHWN